MRFNVMPGARSLKDGGEHFNGNRQRGQFGKGNHLRPDIRALAGSEVRPGKRHVGEPACVRAGIDEQAAPRAADRQPGKCNS